MTAPETPTTAATADQTPIGRALPMARRPDGIPAEVEGRVNLLDLTPAEAERQLRAFAEAQGQPSYRAMQVLPRLWQWPARDFAEMRELPAAFREALAAHFALPRLQLVANQRSSDGTRKFLFRLADGQAIETVAIPDRDRLTFCISSQAGCALKCSFCATGVMGFQRNLHAFEIAGQVRELALLDEEPLKATNIVFMGMGEPLMNWKAVDPTLTILNDPQGCGIGARHITVSTVGVLPGIVALGERPEQFRLAISIHAPTDALRGELMPVNVKYPLGEVIAAAAAFDRRVTFEYVMLGGVNDRPEHAMELARLARECRAFVNLIPLHPGGSLGFTPTPSAQIARFAESMRSRGVEVAVRKSRGVDIAAACGQLRVERLGRRAPRAADDDRDVQVA
ncbi:MAG: 23S rRNA (adenine(2503)-C(2))-methyltransferase RlmN [Gemmatirosa sp.]